MIRPKATRHRVYVAVSGMMTQGDLLQPLARTLAGEHGIAVVGFDKLGFGSSHCDLPAGRPLVHDDVVDAAHAMVRFVANNLEAAFGVAAGTPVHFAGLSLGGSLVHQVCAEPDPSVAGAAVLVPPFNASHAEMDAALRFGMLDPALSAWWLNTGVDALATWNRGWSALGDGAPPIRWMQGATTSALGAVYDWLLRPAGCSIPGTGALRAAELLAVAQALHPVPAALLADLVARTRDGLWPNEPLRVASLTLLCEDDGICPPRHAMAAFQAGGLYDPVIAPRTVVLFRDAGHLDPISVRWRDVVAGLMAAHLNSNGMPRAMRRAVGRISVEAAKRGLTVVSAVTDPAAKPATTRAALEPLKRALGVE